MVMMAVKSIDAASADALARYVYENWDAVSQDSFMRSFISICMMPVTQCVDADLGAHVAKIDTAWHSHTCTCTHAPPRVHIRTRKLCVPLASGSYIYPVVADPSDQEASGREPVLYRERARDASGCLAICW
jgi:hypothetical protein